MEIAKIQSFENGAEVEKSIKVSSKKLFAGLTFTGLVTGLVAALTFLLIDFPNNNQEVKFNDTIEKFDYINFVLRHQNDSIRKESMILLLNAGVIDDPNDKLLKLTLNNNLPNWSDYGKFNSNFRSGNNSNSVPTKTATDSTIDIASPQKTLPNNVYKK